MKLRPETLLKNGSYRIISILGQGGFGITYLAEHIHMCRKVCIKEFFPSSLYRRDDVSQVATVKDGDNVALIDSLKTKFLKEARTISTMDNQHIVRVFDSFEENGTAYYVMEYIEGESLASIVARDGALDETTARRYIAEVADALGYIHARNTLHLDVKPHNIMVRKSDGRAILIDFGLAKHYDDSGSQTTSTLGGRSHGYAPIEQYDDGGVAQFSPETDIYSLGATLYYLVTANHPPRASVVGSNGLPELPKRLSPSLHATITAAMNYAIKQRPHSTQEFMSHLGGGQPAEPNPKRSKWWLWLLLFLAAVGIVCGIVLSGGEDKGEDIVVTPDTEEVVENIEPKPVVPEEKTYKVGDYYNENGKQGVVFEVWDGGRHGKIVSLDETQAEWDSRAIDGNSPRTYADSKSDGKANTDKIMSRSDSQYFDAFEWCRAKGSSWYLPAHNELQKIYNNKSTLNTALQKYGTTLSDGWHWSSTEYVDSEPEFCAWLVDMNYGYTYNSYKYNFYYVRAVSAF